MSLILHRCYYGKLILLTNKQLLRFDRYVIITIFRFTTHVNWMKIDFANNRNGFVLSLNPERIFIDFKNAGVLLIVGFFYMYL